jgi:hypothetical protein
VHKSHALRERNEKVIDAMRSQFTSPKRDPAIEAQLMMRDRDLKNQKDEQVMKEREEIRKKKEWETKLYQDKQVAAKRAILELKEKEKAEWAERIMSEVEEFKVAEEKAKKAKLDKNLEHLAKMKEGVVKNGNMFAKTGVAIINN